MKSLQTDRGTTGDQKFSSGELKKINVKKKIKLKREKMAKPLLSPLNNNVP